MELSEYPVERLRDDGELILYTAHAKQIEQPSLLLLAPASSRPSPETLKKIDYEYSLWSELDPAGGRWSPRPFSGQSGQMTLVLEDPGGRTLDEFISPAMELTRFLGFAGGLATAIAGVHESKLIHQVGKPNSVLVNSAIGHFRLIGFVIASRPRREHQVPKLLAFMVELERGLLVV